MWLGPGENIIRFSRLKRQYSISVFVLCACTHGYVDVGCVYMPSGVNTHVCVLALDRL